MLPNAVITLFNDVVLIVQLIPTPRFVVRIETYLKALFHVTSLHFRCCRVLHPSVPTIEILVLNAPNISSKGSTIENDSINFSPCPRWLVRILLPVLKETFNFTSEKDTHLLICSSQNSATTFNYHPAHLWCDNV